jgi:hypothetical protein
MIRTIITPYEVVKHSPAGRDYPTDAIALLIPIVEQQYGNECLGETLYKWLVDNVNVYPADVVEWCAGTSYSIGDMVVRCGLLFESETDLNTTDPTGESPEWVEVKRFGDNDCANEFWEDHLRQVLAFKLYIRSLNTTTRTTGANGLTVLEGAGAYNNQGFKTASKADLNDYKTQLNTELEAAVANMIRWAKNKGTCEMPINTMPGCVSICAPQSNQRRRWGFRY